MPKFDVVASFCTLGGQLDLSDDHSDDHMHAGICPIMRHEVAVRSKLLQWQVLVCLVARHVEFVVRQINMTSMRRSFVIARVLLSHPLWSHVLCRHWQHNHRQTHTLLT